MESNQEWYDQNQKEMSPQKKPVNGYSIASLVLGICAVVFGCCCYYLAVILGALSIGFSLLYRSGNGAFNGKSMAGLILGIVGVAFAIFSIIASRFMAPSAAELEAILNEYLKILENAQQQ